MSIAEIQVEDITCFWIDCAAHEYNSYDLVEGTVIGKKENNSLRFELKKGEESFEVVIRETDEGYVFKCEDNDEPEEEYKLKLFKGDGDKEFLFIFSDSGEQIYFHIM